MGGGKKLALYKYLCVKLLTTQHYEIRNVSFTRDMGIVA